MNRQPLPTTYKSTVPNHFATYKTFTYTEREVADRYIALFNDGLYPGKKFIVALLNATHDFLQTATTDPYFKPIRDLNFLIIR